MKDLRQIFSGILLAIISATFVLGSMLLAFAEERTSLAEITTVSTVGPEFILTPGLPILTPLMNTQSVTIPALPTACPAPVDWIAIVVQPGDSVESLAQLYQTTVSKLKQINCLVTDNLISGSIIYVPPTRPTESTTTCGPYPGWVFYTIQSEDTLYRISIIYNTTVNELKFANCLISDVIRVGQRIYVPNTPPQYTITPTQTSPPPSLTNTKVPAETSPTITRTEEITPTRQSPTQILISTPTSTSTPTTPTSTNTLQPSETPTYTATLTLPPNTPTATNTFLPSPTETQPPTESPTPTGTGTPTKTPTPPTTTSTETNPVSTP